MVVHFGFFEIVDEFLAFLESKNLDPMYLRIPRLIVFLHTGIDALPATYAAGKIETVAILDAGNRRSGLDIEFAAIFLRVIFLEPFDKIAHFRLTHFTEVLFEKCVPNRSVGRAHGNGKSCGGRARELHEFSPT